MYPVFKELEAAGYIVYTLNADKLDKNGRAFNVQSLPTVVVMDGGKEVERFTGVTSIDSIKSKLKTRDEQKKPNGFDYDLRGMKIQR